MEEEFWVVPEEADALTPLSLLFFLSICDRHGFWLSDNFAQVFVKVQLATTDLRVMELVRKEALLALDILDDLLVIDFFGTLLKLLECQLLELVHDTVEAVLVNQASGQARALVEDEVDIDVVEDVLLQFLVQLFLPLLFKHCKLLNHLRPFVGIGWLADCRDGRALKGCAVAGSDMALRECAHCSRRRFEILGHAHGFERLAFRLWNCLLPLSGDIDLLNGILVDFDFRGLLVVRLFSSIGQSYFLPCSFASRSPTAI